MATIERPRYRRAQAERPLAAFAALNALAAWVGAVGLVGGGLSFGRRLDQRLPFDSRPFAGVALAVVVAIPLSMVALAAWAGDRRTGRAAAWAGALVIGWIIVQLAVLRAFSWFQPTYLVIGAVLVWWGRRVAERVEASSWRPW